MKEALGLAMQSGAQNFAPNFEIVLKPISCPELGEIRIEDSLFAVGRTEPPFASYPPALVAELSRRHARIFSEFGAVYIADLGSKNGTTVNGAAVRQKPSRLQDGDEVCFGRVLSYRVEIGARAASGRSVRLLSLTLTPERGDLGLQPIVVSRFPFLIGKTDEAFARYKDECPHQVNYLSRRHAHIFLKGGLPFIEDLGSTNGTFVAGRRLDEHAAPLQEGDLLAFGGHHFVYQVSLQLETVEIEPTVTRLASFSASAGEAAAEADKTTFVAAADSFLDIFCVDQAGAGDDALAGEVAPAPDAAQGTDGRSRPRGKFVRFLGELAAAFGGGDRLRPRPRRRLLYGASALLAALAVLSLVLSLRPAPERAVQALLAGGDYAQAAALARESLARDPENAELKALGTEALLKATVPKWLRELQARQFERAGATLAATRELALGNAELEAMIDELEWLGRLEQFVIGRGGVDAPIRVYADEARIRTLLAGWDEDPQGHQQALARIASYVPEFREPYAQALSHLRKLQSDDSVYLTAIERLQAAIASELEPDRPEALEHLLAVLDEYAEKYPRLGLEGVRQDLARYRELESAVRAGKPDRLLALAARAQFATPPFRERWQALAANLPPPAVVEQYRAVVKAWREGDTQQALAGLQQMTGGPWGGAAAGQLAHKQAIVERFAALEQARGSAGYGERLLAFHGTLDADEDVHFIRAVEAELGPHQEPLLARGRELLQRAREQWNAYRKNGPIAGEQRLESTISKQFRSQAQRLSEAQQAAQQGLRIITQLKAGETSDLAEWQKLAGEIAAEAELQRKSLQELRTVLAPRLLQSKLALIGAGDDNQSDDQSGDQGQSAETAD